MTCSRRVCVAYSSEEKTDDVRLFHCSTYVFCACVRWRSFQWNLFMKAKEKKRLTQRCRSKYRTERKKKNYSIALGVTACFCWRQGSLQLMSFSLMVARSQEVFTDWFYSNITLPGTSCTCSTDTLVWSNSFLYTCSSDQHGVSVNILSCERHWRTSPEIGFVDAAHGESILSPIVDVISKTKREERQQGVRCFAVEGRVRTTERAMHLNLEISIAQKTAHDYRRLSVGWS